MNGIDMASPRIAVCGICTKSHLAYARMLMADVARFHPDWQRVVLLADDPEGCFNPAGEPFEIVSIDQLHVPAPPSFFFRHTPYELCAACRPRFLKWMVEARKPDILFYLDGDSRVYAPLDAAVEALHRRAGLLIFAQ